MTIHEYVLAVFEKLALPKPRLMEALYPVRWEQVELWREGRADPALRHLERMEAISGISLDEIDPRIHEGIDGLRPLAERMYSGRLQYNTFGRALGLSKHMVSRIIDMNVPDAGGRPAWHLSATAAQTIQAAELLRALEADDEAAFVKQLEEEQAALPHEAWGDRDFMRAKAAFGLCCSPAWRRFGFRRTRPGVYRARGSLLEWRVETLKHGCRVTAWFRESGIPVFERVI